MKRVWIIALAVAVAGLTGLHADEAKPERPQRERPDGAPQARQQPGGLIRQAVLDQLDLSAEQQTRVKALVEQFTAEMEALRGADAEESKRLREQFRAAREANDEAKLEALREKFRAQTEPARQLRQKYLEELRALLTAEQKQKLETLTQQARDRAGQAREDRGRTQPGGGADE
jgi:Spy/CpxP family protein refolding chaperone